MTTGLTVQSQSPGSAHADLGFWLQSQVIGQPMAMTAEHLKSLVETISANRFVLPRNRKTGARITDKGTAIVEIHGVLVNRSPVLGSFWGLTAYEGLAEQFRRLATHDDVKRIVLDINSPGGLVAGIRGCTEALERLADKKPVYAISHDMAYSAGYWIACLARELSVTPDGGVGSIGVRSGHVSYAESLDRAGIQVTTFTAGATKADGNPYALLTDGEAAEHQFKIERDNDRFIAHVAAHRPLSEGQIRDTDARTFVGEDALASGLADRVESLEDMVERLERAPSQARPKSKRSPAPSPQPSAGIHPQHGDRLMPQTDAGGGSADFAERITQALIDIGARTPASAQAPAAAPTAAPAPAAAQTAVSDADRIFAILDCEEAKERPKLAQALAKSGIAVDAAKAILAAAAVEAKADDKEEDGDKADLANALERQMAKPGNAAAIKPDGTAAQRPSLAERVEQKFSTQKRRV